MPRIFFALITLVSSLAWGYPEFIGYKYASCATCHYNTHGNGPLNDYGRALWASEIAGRLWSGNKTDEQLAASSGFLGKTPLPWWFRPGVKARYLYVKPEANKARNILMQMDANMAVHFDKNQKFIFVASLGYVPEPLRLQNKKNSPKVDTFISREHYFRWHLTEPLWLSVGMMDKVYGIRIVDHTAFSRSRTGVAQNDQTHGLMAHFIKPDWEFTVHAFGGNMQQDSDLRQKGVSLMYETEAGPNWWIGASALTSSNEYIKNLRGAIHSRTGLGWGSSILFELGYIQDHPIETEKPKNGYYLYMEAMQRLSRGYHLFFTGQSYKDDTSANRPDNLKYGVGLLMFPRDKIEFRTEVENSRQVPAGMDIPPDIWSLLLQVHISL